jgi:hypothetical protein
MNDVRDAEAAPPRRAFAEVGMSTCDVCGARVSELRRGRCWGCYSRWVEDRPVGIGARCCVCNERRREFLKSVEFRRSWLPMCHNCAGRVGMLDPLPRSIAGIRAALTRDRRRGERRVGQPDGRLSPRERRAGERRGGGDEVVDDGMILEMWDLADEIESADADADADADELTQIRPAPSW